MIQKKDNVKILSMIHSKIPFKVSKTKMGRKTGFLGFSYCIVYALRMALCAIDIVLDYLLGFTIRHGFLNERFMSKSYEYSAQLVDVVAWGTHSYHLTVPNNYVVRHNKYINPKYVLQHDNITLMGITPTQAFFCVSDAKVDVQNIKVSSTRIYCNCAILTLTCL